MIKYILILVGLFILGVLGYVAKGIMSGKELSDYPEWSVIQVALAKGLSDGDKFKLIDPADRDHRVVLLVRAKCSKAIVGILLSKGNGYKQIPDDVPAIDSEVLSRLRGVSNLSPEVYSKLESLQSASCQ